MKYHLAIFDMDGTLTEELLDFAAIRRDIGLPPQGGILERISQMPAHAQSQANAILDRHELTAADTCRVHEGAAELLHQLHRSGVKTALLTRNSAACARRILARHQLTLDHIATREDLPHKPHPASILNITRQFAIDPRQTLMVGDYLYDLQAAQAAGVDSALFRANPAEKPPDFAPMATYRITHLRQLLKIIHGGPHPADEVM